MTRGDIHYIYLSESDTIGSEQRAGRPAVIVSNDMCNKHSNVVEVVFLTTQDKKDLPTHVQVHSSKFASTALCEQVHSISTQRIGDYAGKCTDSEMEAIDEALLVSLGLSMDKPVSEPECGKEALRMKGERDAYKGMCEKLLELLSIHDLRRIYDMTNREKLLQTNPYDMLLKMHEYMMNKAPSCVLEPLGKKCNVTVGTCDDCIEKWLNEEAKQWTKST